MVSFSQVPPSPPDPECCKSVYKAFSYTCTTRLYAWTLFIKRFECEAAVVTPTYGIRLSEADAASSGFFPSMCQNQTTETTKSFTRLPTFQFEAALVGQVNSVMTSKWKVI